MTPITTSLLKKSGKRPSPRGRAANPARLDEPVVMHPSSTASFFRLRTGSILWVRAHLAAGWDAGPLQPSWLR